jgi:hypothetical protein
MSTDRMTPFMAALKEFGIDDLDQASRRCTTTESGAESMQRYLLVEENVGSAKVEQPCYLSTHDSPQEAATYAAGQEYPEDWAVRYLLDLDTGERFSAEVSITFIPEAV